MAASHYIKPQGAVPNSITVRLGGGTGSSNNMSAADVGKAVKLVAESRFNLCDAGDPIEGFITSVDLATSGGYSIGGVVEEGLVNATADGLEATAGTGVIALGDYVVAGTATAKGTALTNWAKVCKATNQPGTAIVSTVATADTAAAVKVALDAVLVKVADVQANLAFAWRVVSLGSAGTGAVGTDIVIQRVAV